MKPTPTFTIKIHHVAEPPPDLLPLAQALLSLHADPVLDSALVLAHDLTARHHQHRAVQHSIETAAARLYAQLSHLEEQLQRVA